MKPKKILLIKISSFLILTFVIFGYGIFQARNLITGPEIKVTAPISGENVSSPLVTISGLAKNINQISLNDRSIFIDKQGNFSEKLLVQPGYSIIKLAARDKFGRTTQKLLELNYTSDKATDVAVSTDVSTTTSTSTLSLVKFIQ